MHPNPPALPRPALPCPALIIACPHHSQGGTVDVDIKTWRPQGDIHSKMVEFFLGSAARLKDPLFAEIPHKKGK